MDGQRFDELARRLGQGTSRRGVLKGIAAGVGASVFGFSIRQAPKASAEVGVPCATDDDCDDGEFCFGATEPQSGTCQLICLSEGQACSEVPCCEGLVCYQGACRVDLFCVGTGAHEVDFRQ